MGWPKDLEDKIVNKANEVAQWAKDESKGELKGARLREFFVKTGAVRGDVPLEPFKVAASQGRPPVLWGAPRNWCGIFAVFIYKEAALSDARWDINRPRSKHLRLVPGGAGIGRGDLGVIQGKRIKIRQSVTEPTTGLPPRLTGVLTRTLVKEVWSNHHFIVVEDLGDSIRTVEGNAGLDFIKSGGRPRSKRDIWYYYTYTP
jgi:hypothetical protein